MASQEEKSRVGRREEITQIATDLFLKNGFAGTSMSTVAMACGLTKASLYHHFKSKEELFIACVTSGYGDAMETLESILNDERMGARDKLTAAVNCLYDTIIRSPVGRMSPLIAEVSRSFPNVACSFHAHYIQPQDELMQAILRQAADAGLFSMPERRIFSHMLFGPIVTLSLSREMFSSFDNIDEHFPIEELQKGHIKQLWVMLESGQLT